MRTPENLLHDRIEANGHDWDTFRNQCRDYLPLIYSAMAHHSVEYMQGLRQALRDVRKHRNDLIARTIASYEIDRVNLVAMTLERDEFDEANKKLAGELRSYKQWLREREESMKRMEQEIKVLETKIQFLEPYKELVNGK